MGFSFASVLLSYFSIAGGTFLAGLLAVRLGIHSEYVGYMILAAGGFLGGVIAARASKGSTIVEPAVGALLLVASFIAVGLARSGAGAGVLLLPAAMKAIALTSAASGGGGIAGAFVTEKLFGRRPATSAGWILYVLFAAFGGGVIASIFSSLLAPGESGALFGLLVACAFLVGIATGASAVSRPLGASFLGGTLGLGAFFGLAIYMFVSVMSSVGSAESVPPGVYAGLAILAVGGGIVTLIGSSIGWLAVGSKRK